MASFWAQLYDKGIEIAAGIITSVSSAAIVGAAGIAIWEMWLKPKLDRERERAADVKNAPDVQLVLSPPRDLILENCSRRDAMSVSIQLVEMGGWRLSVDVVDRLKAETQKAPKLHLIGKGLEEFVRADLSEFFMDACGEDLKRTIVFVIHYSDVAGTGYSRSVEFDVNRVGIQMGVFPKVTHGPIRLNPALSARS